MSTAAFLRRSALRYAAGARATVGILMAAVAPFAAPPAGMLLCGIVAVVLAGWSVAYLRLMRTRPATWVWVIDVAFVCALCLAQQWLVDPVLLVRFLGWVAPLASLTVVALQWYTRPLPGALAVVCVCTAFVVGATVDPSVAVNQALEAGGLWMAVEAGLSRLLWRLVRRGGALADEQAAQQLAVLHRAEVARARRAGERADWATVHDTAASTLLMVGLGQVRGTEAWLPGQIERDVAALRGVAVAESGLQEVVLRAVRDARITVDLHGDADLLLPGPAAGALGGAVGETLENVHRHAGTASAEIELEVVDTRVRITVRDHGRGFDPGEVPDHRYGLTRSVHDRMAEAGGRAVVESAPGRGTVVRLEWPA